jgi:transcriptional regulator with XRE-family HTH domain
MQVLGHIQRLIRSERQQKGLTQQDLAKEAKLSKTQISKIETAAQIPNLETLDKVLVGLGLSFAEFSRRYLEIERAEQQSAQGPRGGPFEVPGSAELLDLTEQISRGSFETERHYVVVIPKR